jgi:hypothetical protein
MHMSGRIAVYKLLLWLSVAARSLLIMNVSTFWYNAPQRCICISSQGFTSPTLYINHFKLAYAILDKISMSGFIN